MNKWHIFQAHVSCYAVMCVATRGSEVNSVFRECRMKGEVFSPLFFHSERVSYHWLFSSVGLWRAVHWLFEVASRRKWGRKSIIDFTFCLTQTVRTEKHIRSKVLAVGQLPLLCVTQGYRGETKGWRRWGGTPDNTNASLPGVIPSVLFPTFLFLMAE